jgi:hypothetical protein
MSNISITGVSAVSAAAAAVRKELQPKPGGPAASGTPQATAPATSPTPPSAANAPSTSEAKSFRAMLQEQERRIRWERAPNNSRILIVQDADTGSVIAEVGSLFDIYSR